MYLAPAPTSLSELPFFFLSLTLDVNILSNSEIAAGSILLVVGISTIIDG